MRWWLGDYDDDKHRALGRSIYTDTTPMSFSERALLVCLIGVQVITWLWVAAGLLQGNHFAQVLHTLAKLFGFTS